MPKGRYAFAYRLFLCQSFVDHIENFLYGIFENIAFPEGRNQVIFQKQGDIPCLLKLMLCLFCLYAFRRTWTTRGLKNPMRPLEEMRFSKKERLMMAAVALLVILAEVLS